MADDHEVSKKLNVIIALLIRQLANDKEFAPGKRKSGTGEVVRYLSAMGLEPKDIGNIVGSPVTSVRTLLTPKRRKK